MYRTTENTQKRKDEKKKMILDAAAGVFSRKGYHNATVRDIVNEAAVSVGSFYFYFNSKEDLFSELYRGIVKEFGDVTASVLDVEHFTMLKNFTRVMAATLWMYEQKRDIARIVFSEMLTAEPSFKALEEERINSFVQVMTGWFGRFKLHSGVNIPDEKAAALIYAGSYQSLVSYWLKDGAGAPLTGLGYAFCVYNLQALGIAFNEPEVKEYIGEVLSELELRL